MMSICILKPFRHLFYWRNFDAIFKITQAWLVWLSTQFYQRQCCYDFDPISGKSPSGNTIHSINTMDSNISEKRWKVTIFKIFSLDFMIANPINKIRDQQEAYVGWIVKFRHF